MATLSRVAVDRLTRRLNRLSRAARAAVERTLTSIEFEDVADLREQAVAALEPILGAATDAAAAVSAIAYDEISEEATGRRFGAQAVSNRNPAATEGAIRALVGLPFDSFLAEMRDRADYEIKSASGECMAANADADPQAIGFARVPTGAETCDWCLWLASFGFVYKTSAAAGHLRHWHGGCDCRIVQGYAGVDVEGYDPWALEDELRGRIRGAGIEDKEFSQLTKQERNAIRRKPDE